MNGFLINILGIFVILFVFRCLIIVGFLYIEVLSIIGKYNGMVMILIIIFLIVVFIINILFILDFF